MNAAWLFCAVGCIALGVVLAVLAMTGLAQHAPNGYGGYESNRTISVSGNGHPAPIQCRWHVVSYTDGGSVVIEDCNQPR